MIFGKYKPGQIVTLKDFNTRYVCKVAKSTDGCTPCCFYNYCTDVRRVKTVNKIVSIILEQMYTN